MLKRRVHRRTAAALAVLVSAGAVAGAAEAAKIVRTIGGTEWKRNGYISDTVRWAPGAIVVRPNERVTWVDRDRKQEPHTVTFVNRRERPSNPNQVFQCRACELANAHLEDPSNPNSPVARVRVDVGRAGLNQRGDSLYHNQRARIGGVVTARPGQTLYYICAIHAWMQGSIRVTRTGTTRAQPARAVRGTGGAELTGRVR
jgi:plastocyanin